MSRSPSYVGVTAAVYCLASFFSVSSSQIIGCDNLDCQKSTDDYFTTCPLASDGVGAISFDSNVTTEGPLTWTVVGNTDRYTSFVDPKGAKRMWKSFYLGTPQSLLLENANFHGCSLAFFNISSALQVVPGYSDFTNFGCDTVLGDQCATDVLAQAQEELTNRLAAISSTDRDVCGPVEDAVRSRGVPGSCNLPFGRTTWGLINPAAIGAVEYGKFASQPQQNCDITGQGSAYNTAGRNNFYLAGEPESEEGQLWLNGTTPIITMFFKRSGDTNEGIVNPEVHLHCLRTVPSAKDQSSEGHRALTTHTAWVTVAVFGLFALIW